MSLISEITTVIGIAMLSTGMILIINRLRQWLAQQVFQDEANLEPQPPHDTHHDG